jgi:hypothetical protein
MECNAGLLFDFDSVSCNYPEEVIPKCLYGWDNIPTTTLVETTSSTASFKTTVAHTSAELTTGTTGDPDITPFGDYQLLNVVIE